MNSVATNVRFPADEYEQLRTLAFLERKPIAKIIRDSVKMYKAKTSDNNLELFKLMVKSQIKIDIPTLDLVARGRRI